MLETLQETLSLDLAAAPRALHPVIAEASVARSAAMLADQLWPAGRPDEIGEVERFFWADAARVLGERRDVDSFVLLTSLARTVGPAGRLPLQRAHLSRLRTQAEVPEWVTRIAGFRLTSAIVSEDITGDGLSVVLDYDDEQHPHTVVVFIDNNLGAIVKDVFVGPPVDRVLEAYQRGGRVTIRTVRPSTAAGIILQALGETDDYDDPPVSEDFEFFSGLLVNRLTQLPERPIRPPIRPLLSPRQRDQLVDEFLESRHAMGLSEDAADIIRLWIDHAVDHTVGGPLRVSAVLVELFLAHWLPRKVLADSTYFEAVPVAVKAWLEFAGERTHLPLDAIDEAVDAVDVWTPALEAAAMIDPVGSKPGERVFLDDTTNDLEDAYRALVRPGFTTAAGPARPGQVPGRHPLRPGPTRLADGRRDVGQRLRPRRLRHRRTPGPRRPRPPHQGPPLDLAPRHRLAPGPPPPPGRPRRDPDPLRPGRRPLLVPRHPPQNRQTPHRHPHPPPLIGRCRPASSRVPRGLGGWGVRTMGACMCVRRSSRVVGG